MIGIDGLISMVAGLQEAELRRWIDERWVRPEPLSGGYVFREVDVARVRLIVELRQELAIDEEALPVVLQLLDQVYALRRRLRAMSEAIDAQPEAVRGVIGGLLEPPVVERHHLGLAIFEEKLTVIGALQAVREMAAGAVAVETGAVEKRDGG